MSNHWNASNYQQRVASRIATVKPEWITMPSGEKFYLRKVATMLSSALAAHMPNALTKKAVDAWKKTGVIEIPDADEITGKMSSEEMTAAAHETARLSQIVQQACVIPFLSNDNPGTIEFPEEWKESAIAGIQEQDKDFDPETFDPKLLVVNPHALDGDDAEFLLYKWATGLVGSVGLKGGGAVNVSDLERFRKKLNRGSRTGSARQKHRKSA